MFRVVEESAKTCGIHEACLKIKNHGHIPVLKISFNKNQAYYYKLNGVYGKGLAWTNIFKPGLLNKDGGDEDKFYETLHQALEGPITGICKDQYTLHIFNNPKEMLTWLLGEIS